MAQSDSDENPTWNTLRVTTQGLPLEFEIIDGAIVVPILSRRKCGVRLVGEGVETGGWIVCGDQRSKPLAYPHGVIKPETD